MTLPCSPNSISFGQIQTEFGGSNPIRMTEYYGAASGIPANGTIRASDFRCKSAWVYAGSNVYEATSGSGSITLSKSTYGVQVRVLGGGGGGGGANSSPSGTFGGGGGSGGWIDISRDLPKGTTISWTVGAGGGAGFANYPPGDGFGYGDNGGTTIVTVSGVGSYICTGGIGGTNTGIGGSGGSSSILGAAYYVSGYTGGNWQSSQIGGVGANSQLGVGGFAIDHSDGGAGGLGAGGGGGAGSDEDNYRHNGGPGGSGYIRIIY